jgi:uncharacterized protein
VTKAGDKELSGYFATLSASKYMLLTTFRRDGRAVARPVHVVAEADRAFFRTLGCLGQSQAAPSLPHGRGRSSRGRSRRLAVQAKVVLLDGEASDQAARVLAHKHPLLHGRLIPWYHRRRGWTTQQYRVEPP